MIILGPEDADLNGAPSYYRTGNWRPRTATSTEQKDTGSIPSIPFDWCEKVLEYDVRFGGKPDDATTQPTTWVFQSGGAGSTGDWTVEDTGAARALRFNVGSGNASYWEKEETLVAHPDRVAGYAVFMVDSFGTSSNVEAGFDLRVLGSENSSTFRGARGVWTQDFNYVKVGTTEITDVATTVPIDDVTAVWHRVAFDAPVVGGDKAINALDDQINYDSKSFFGSVSGTGTKIAARFGKTVSGGTNDALQGRIRNFVASAPGRFVRAWFRSFASSATMSLRLVLVSDAFLPTGSDNGATFKVRYASRATGSNPFAVPNPSPPLTGNVTFTTANTVQILTLSLTGLTANEPFWFTVERVFGAVSPETHGTVHLLQAILTPSS